MKNPALDRLNKTQDLIRDPSNWCQGSTANIEKSRCVLDALALATRTSSQNQYVLDKTYIQVKEAIRAAMYPSPSDSESMSIVFFNDSHSHSEVMEALDKAREILSR